MVRCGWGSPLWDGREMAGCYDGMSWDLLWLKVTELSRLPSCCNLACIIPVLLRETGNVWDFRSWTMGPNPSWFLQHEWNGIEAKVRCVTLQREGSISEARTWHRGDEPRTDSAAEQPQTHRRQLLQSSQQSTSRQRSKNQAKAENFSFLGSTTETQL